MRVGNLGKQVQLRRCQENWSEFGYDSDCGKLNIWNLTWTQLVTINVVLIVAIASPGPAMLMATQTSLRAGRAAGIAVGAGLGLMAAIWTMMALLGFGLVFELFPFLYVGAKAAGATYLLYVAYRMWRSAGFPAKPVIKPTGRAFRQGFLVNLFSPKSVLFAAAVLVTVFQAGPGLADSVVIVANHFLVEIAFYTALAFGISTQAVAKRYMRAKI